MSPAPIIPSAFQVCVHANVVSVPQPRVPQNREARTGGVSDLSLIRGANTTSQVITSASPGPRSSLETTGKPRLAAAWDTGRNIACSTFVPTAIDNLTVRVNNCPQAISSFAAVSEHERAFPREEPLVTCLRDSNPVRAPDIVIDGRVARAGRGERQLFPRVAGAILRPDITGIGGLNRPGNLGDSQS